MTKTNKSKHDYKAEAEKYLNLLKQRGISRNQIESELELAKNYITEQLSKGGNKKFVKRLRDYVDKILQNAMPGESDESIVEESVVEYGTSFKTLVVQQNKLIVSLNKQSETANGILQRIADNVEQRVKTIDANLNDALGRVDSLKLDVYSGRIVTLQSLARLEKKPVNSLLSEADNIIASLLDQQQQKQNKTSEKGK